MLTNQEDETEVVELVTEWPIQPSSSSTEDQKDILSHSKKTKRKYSSPNNVNYQKFDTSKKQAVEVEQLANISIAKWWRKQPCSIRQNYQLPSSHNANTLLSAICKLPITIDFINSEVQRLKSKLEWCRTADVYATLGSFLEKTKNFSESVKHLSTAIDMCETAGSNRKEYKWLYHKVQKQYQILKKQTEALNELEGNKSQHVFPQPLQVERVMYADLSVKEFYDKYSSTSTPVIISGLVSHMTSSPWTLQHVREQAGDCEVILKKLVQGSSEWARLEENSVTTVGSYIEGILHKSPQTSYLFDWSLPIHCPKLAQELTIPKYFANDFLQRSSQCSLYKDSWPSMFIAPAGLKSELHIDAFGSNFWMAVFEGTKRWTFFPQSDLPFLYPQYEHSMDPVFDVELGNIDFSRHPLMSLCHPMGCDLTAGEVLFVPAGCPHHVENLTASLAISANFVDQSNFNKVKKEMEYQALVDPRSAELLQQFTSPSFKSSMDLTIQDLTFQKFKSVSCV